MGWVRALAEGLVQGLFAIGIAAGAIALLINVYGVPENTIVKRGWLEHDGKVYRVVPAEVR